jgi:hypothetical protein
LTTLQWVHSKLVGPNVTLSLDGPNPFTWCTEVFPYTVPTGYWLGIIHASVSTKFTDGGAGQRASMLVIPNVLMVPDNNGALNFSRPVVVPEGQAITANYINNDAEQQWFTSIVQAALAPKLVGQSYQDAFSDWVA